MHKSNNDLIFFALKQIVGDLVKAIGIPCEIVLHDHQDPSHSIIAIAGELTGRKVDGPMTDMGLKIMRSGKFDKNLIAYSTNTPDGKPLRSSTLYIHNEMNEVIGSLCINIDLTYWKVILNLLSDFCESKPTINSSEEIEETFETDVPEVLRSRVDRALKAIGQPVSLMSKNEKLKVVQILDNDGFFLIRGSVEFVADALSVSRPTIYNYLGEIRKITMF